MPPKGDGFIFLFPTKGDTQKHTKGTNLFFRIYFSLFQTWMEQLLQRIIRREIRQRGRHEES
ncbi:hypothetical protein SCFA_780008 [anaerobic digester metagenome]|uniref:Uncharacterized protein n=1 Tax=anaerobic digester metagenome TaxID=1263854 RepID=A0A485M4B7_9ZZZZ